jgi:hypothetical protein
MLEEEGRLRTWELAATPSPGVPVDALQLPHHRLDYLTYEGPVSHQRGTVRRWDSGEFQLLSAAETQLEIQVSGQLLQGRLVIRRTAASTESWQVLFEPALPNR